MLFRLGAEGSDHYRDVQEIIPALNASQHLLTAALNAIFDTKKEVAEQLRELNFDAIFQTNWWGEVDLDGESDKDDPIVGTGTDLPKHKIWTVVGVHPEFYHQGGSAPLPVTIMNPLKSFRKTSAIFKGAIKSAARSTQEKRARNTLNKFQPGNTALTGGLKEYGYFFGSTARNTINPQVGRVITIFPHTPQTFTHVAISYLKVPRDVVAITDTMEWPESMLQLIVSMALRQIAYKQGDRTDLSTLSTQESSMLLQSFA
jgi:hypothetical protein